MNITKEEIKSAGLQHVEDVKGGNACYDSFVAGAEYMQQKLEQCNVSGALPPVTSEEILDEIEFDLSEAKVPNDQIGKLIDRWKRYYLIVNRRRQ